MRIAALYDIHGNLPALEAVLDEVARLHVDAIVVGGDVLPGPAPRECLRRLSEIEVATRFIQGNGERVVRAQMSGHEPLEVPERFRHVIRWNADQLRPEDAEWMASWPQTLSVTVPPLGEIHFCHATPRSDAEVVTGQTPENELRPILDPLNVNIVVCGHTHVQFDRRVGQTRVVNAGSVGMPFERPAAYWLLIGPEVELRRTTYDVANAANRIRASGYPQADEFIANYVVGLSEA